MSDKIRFKCSCGKSLAAEARHAGKKVACPDCKAVLRIPVPKAAEAPIEPTEQYDPLGLPNAAEFETGVPVSSPSQLQQPKPLASAQKPNPYAGRQIKTPAPVKSKPVATGNSVAGLIVAAVVALFATVTWLMIAMLTGMELGIVAWGIGGLVGLVAGAIGRNSSPAYCGTAAAFAIGSVVMAKLVMAIALMGISNFSNLIDDIAVIPFNKDKEAHAVAESMIDTGAFNEQENKAARIYVDAYFSQDFSSETSDELFEANNTMLKKVANRLNEMSPAETEAAIAEARKNHPEWIEDQNHFYAAVHLLANEAGALSEELKEHAEYTLEQANNNYLDDYYQSISPNEMTERTVKLRKEAVRKLLDLDSSDRDQAVLDLLAEKTQWNPFPDAKVAMMSKLFKEGRFKGDLGIHVDANLKNVMTDDYPKYLDDVDYELQSKRQKEVDDMVSKELALLNPEQRKALVIDVKSQNPSWQTYQDSLGNIGEFGGLGDALEDEGLELSDGSFFGSLAMVLSFYDILWVSLCGFTAFGTAQKFGDESAA